jgi:hypothetical protein
MFGDLAVAYGQTRECEIEACNLERICFIEDVCRAALKIHFLSRAK